MASLEPRWQRDRLAAGIRTPSGVLDWRVARVQDPSGHDVVAYTWELPPLSTPGEIPVPNLAEIRYGDVRIEFFGQQRPDPVVTATGSGLAVNDQRLLAVGEYAGLGPGRTLRIYALRYGVHTNASNKSFLTQVQEYGRDATIDRSGVEGPHSLPPVSLAANLGDGSSWAINVHTGISWASDWPAAPDASGAWDTVDISTSGHPPASWEPADVTGDHRADLVSLSPPVRDDPSCTNQCPAWSDLVTEVSQSAGGYARNGQPWRLILPNPGAHAQLLLGDVNGDGLTDASVLVSDLAGDRLTAALSNGDGSFAPTVADTTLRAASGLSLREPPWQHDPGFATSGAISSGAPLPHEDRWLMADVNGDGRADLIGLKLSEVGTHRVSITAALGNGDGTFSVQPTVKTNIPGAAAADVQVSDPNGDSRAGLTFFENARDAPDHTAHIWTVQSDGAGSFQVQDFSTGHDWSEYDPVLHPSDQVVGVERTDVNRDRRTDLVIIVAQPLGSPDQIWTALSQGGGNYTLVEDFLTGATELQTPLWLNQIVTGDFNGDGGGDIAIVSGSSLHPAVARLISERDGHWQPTGIASPPGASGAVLLGAGDVNGDGRDDVLFAANAPTPAGTPQFIADLTSVGPSPAHFLVGDVNGDGREDLIYPITTPTGVQVRVLRQNTAGGFDPLPPVGVPLAVTHLAQSDWFVMDVNGDGRADLVNLDGEHPTVTLLSTTDGGWQPVTTDTMLPANAWRISDVNGDGRSDLVRVAVAGTPSNPEPPLVEVLYGQPDGTLTLSTQQLHVAAFSSDALNWLPVDAEGDHQPDLVRVHIDPSTNSPIVQTLVNRGGTWTLTQTNVTAQSRGTVTPSAPLHDGGWLPVATTADGTTDLVELSQDSSGGTWATRLASDGTATGH